MRWLAIDVGGANLKAADGCGFAVSRPFALWREPARLAAEIAELLAACPPHDRLAATMTGELADCFENKAEGVRAIVAALVQSAACDVLIYATDGQLLTPAAASESPLRVAASNWHALATFAGRISPVGAALLVDVGSTTSDIIPLQDGVPTAAGSTDPERLLSGELVYQGVERTPVAALVTHLPWQGQLCPVSTELFATATDAHILAGTMAADPLNTDTADGRPRTVDAAHARIARMICADATMMSIAEARAAAAAIFDAQQARLAAAMERVAGRMPAAPQAILLSGHGEFLIRAALAGPARSLGRARVLSLNEALGPEVSRCAPAHALAALAAKRWEHAGLHAPTVGPSQGRDGWSP